MLICCRARHLLRTAAARLASTSAAGQLPPGAATRLSAGAAGGLQREQARQRRGQAAVVVNGHLRTERKGGAAQVGLRLRSAGSRGRQQRRPPSGVRGGGQPRVLAARQCKPGTPAPPCAPHLSHSRPACRGTCRPRGRRARPPARRLAPEGWAPARRRRPSRSGRARRGRRRRRGAPAAGQEGEASGRRQQAAWRDPLRAALQQHGGR